MSDNVHQLRPALALELEAQMARLAISQNRVAALTGISSSAISQWRRGQYKGDNAAVDLAIRTWLNTEEELEGHKTEGAQLDRHLRLQVTGEITSLFAYAQAAGDIVLVTGASGTGKTWAARRYCETHSATHYVQMRSCVRSLSGMLKLVARAVGGKVASRSPSALDWGEAVVDRLEGRSAFLAVDECQYLMPSLLDELQCVRDIAGCGLALIGQERLSMRLAGSPHILGRIGAETHRRGPSEPDVELLVSAFLERPATRGEVQLGLAAAGGAGGLHALRRTLMRAWRLSRIEDRDTVTAADLEMAALGAAPADEPDAGEGRRASA